jgi:hypothetical protein
VEDLLRKAALMAESSNGFSFTEIEGLVHAFPLESDGDTPKSHAFCGVEDINSKNPDQDTLCCPECLEVIASMLPRDAFEGLGEEDDEE